MYLLIDRTWGTPAMVERGKKRFESIDDRSGYMTQVLVAGKGGCNYFTANAFRLTLNAVSEPSHVTPSALMKLCPGADEALALYPATTVSTGMGC